jgi:DNA-binding transcriptional ArsR family regulator
MAKKSFLLVSLNESKTKKLAEVISNNTCRKMLDYLAEKNDSTESDIAKNLNIPISTVNYNMKALVEAKLVKCDEYHYSEKGKEVNHYKLANQFVIIAPEGDKSMLREKLRSIIPTALIIGAAAGIIKLFSGTVQMAAQAGEPMLQTAMKAAPAAAPIAREAATYAADNAAESAPMLASQAPEVGGAVQQAVSNAPEIALWFFIGAVSGVIVYLLVEWIVRKIRARREK